jgi:hypothetical protein
MAQGCQNRDGVSMAATRWDDEGKRVLRELGFLYLFKAKPGPGAMTFAELARRVDDVRPPEKRHSKSGASYQGLRRFLFNQVRSPHSPELLDGLLRVVVTWLRDHQDDKELKQSPYLPLVERLGWLALVGKRTTKRKPAKAHEEEDRIVESVAVLAEMLTTASGIDEHHFEDAAEKLVGRRRCSGEAATHEDKAGFLTYRYGATPGNLVRSFTVVAPPSERQRFCWFENFYRNKGTGYSRDCAGVAVQLRDGIYMLGLLGPRDGFKLMVLPSANASATILCGLVATSSGEGDPLMARVVLQRTNVTSLSKLPAELKPDAIAYPRSLTVLANEELKWRLRNHIAFEIGTEIRTGRNRRSMTAGQMKAEVGELCEGRFFLNGEVFNPADHIHYPFNQSLMCYHPVERRGGAPPVSEAGRARSRARDR